MSITPLTSRLPRLIRQFFDEMDNPQFMIEYSAVTSYIVSLTRCDDGPITAHLLSSILSQHIGYAPSAFIEDLVGQSVGNTDLECMVLLYSLLMMDFLPPSDMRISINRMIYSHSGEDLKRHLVDNLDNNAGDWLQNQLQRIL